MNNIIPHTPAEGLAISPEALEIANAYLQSQDLHKVAADLNVPLDRVTQYLARREVKAYIDSVFLDYGFNNRFKLRSIMDAVINKKLEEMSEADIGSSKDIADLLTISHKMTMDILNANIKLEEAKNKVGIRTQTNVQINEGSGGNTSNYHNLLSKLMSPQNITLN